MNANRTLMKKKGKVKRSLATFLSYFFSSVFNSFSFFFISVLSASISGSLLLRGFDSVSLLTFCVGYLSFRIQLRHRRMNISSRLSSTLPTTVQAASSVMSASLGAGPSGFVAIFSALAASAVKRSWALV